MVPSPVKRDAQAGPYTPWTLRISGAPGKLGKMKKLPYRLLPTRGPNRVESKSKSKTILTNCLPTESQPAIRISQLASPRRERQKHRATSTMDGRGQHTRFAAMYCWIHLEHQLIPIDVSISPDLDLDLDLDLYQPPHQISSPPSA